MLKLINYKELERIAFSISREWGINIQIEETDFSINLPRVLSPQNGIITFPKRMTFHLLLYHLICSGAYRGNLLVNINEKLNAALRIDDVELAEKFKDSYIDALNKLLEDTLSSDDIEYDMRNTILFYLYHELTHIRIAQQPNFYEEKMKELEMRVRSAGFVVRYLMNRSLKGNDMLREEVICDLEACIKLRTSKKNIMDIKETLRDIVHTINIMNCINNLRGAYIDTKQTAISTYMKLTHSNKTNNSISRFTFIQNYWAKEGVLLSSKEIMKDIVSTTTSLSINQETLDFCREEIRKDEEGFINDDATEISKKIKNEISDMETFFVNKIINKFNPQRWHE